MNKQIIKDTAEYNYNLGYLKAREEILKFIETERDNGNMEGHIGFSASLCLSKLIKELEKEDLKK